MLVAIFITIDNALSNPELFQYIRPLGVAKGSNSYAFSVTLA